MCHKIQICLFNNIVMSKGLLGSGGKISLKRISDEMADYIFRGLSSAHMLKVVGKVWKQLEKYSRNNADVDMALLATSKEARVLSIYSRNGDVSSMQEEEVAAPPENLGIVDLKFGKNTKNTAQVAFNFAIYQYSFMSDTWSQCFQLDMGYFSKGFKIGNSILISNNDRASLAINEERDINVINIEDCISRP